MDFFHVKIIDKIHVKNYMLTKFMLKFKTLINVMLKYQ
jgi:hypothetical protein